MDGKTPPAGDLSEKYVQPHKEVVELEEELWEIEWRELLWGEYRHVLSNDGTRREGDKMFFSTEMQQYIAECVIVKINGEPVKWDRIGRFGQALYTWGFRKFLAGGSKNSSGASGT